MTNLNELLTFDTKDNNVLYSGETFQVQHEEHQVRLKEIFEALPPEQQIKFEKEINEKLKNLTKDNYKQLLPDAEYDASQAIKKYSVQHDETHKIAQNTLEEIDLKIKNISIKNKVLIEKKQALEDVDINNDHPELLKDTTKQIIENNLYFKKFKHEYNNELKEKHKALTDPIKLNTKPKEPKGNFVEPDFTKSGDVKLIETTYVRYEAETFYFKYLSEGISKMYDLFELMGQIFLYLYVFLLLSYQLLKD